MIEAIARCANNNCDKDDWHVGLKGINTPEEFDKAQVECHWCGKMTNQLQFIQVKEDL